MEPGRRRRAPRPLHSALPNAAALRVGESAPPRGRNLKRVVSKAPYGFGRFRFTASVRVTVCVAQCCAWRREKVGPAAIIPHPFYLVRKGGLPKVTHQATVAPELDPEVSSWPGA